MKNLSLSIILAFLVSSCASSYVSDQSISQPEKAYHHILVMSLFNDINLKKFDEETYYSSIKDYFYDLNRIDNHPLLQNCIKEFMASNRTIVVPNHTLFKVNQDISYEDFLETIDKKDIDAILIINQQNYFYEKKERILEDGEIRVDESPNAVFNTYLVDRKNLEAVWVSRIYSSGTSWDSHGSMYNSMGRKLTKKLIKSGYIRPPFYSRNVSR
ncbi:hypothetical protein DWB61_10045 [Ancylomarina euxinus]|uniref:Lipoprotein n=1 Tax=Ancylomarina euxinus TaxID=2283627 RepID=A0A425Y139_9BACT|nr:hypothetical protein [Ancylomarina euxinus]MCZ4693731.1 hypothetical protein [Ancylomarina euxinus]MUP15189.1 hypothetical protein [Ancylomarina euxinus]RRG21611.1 hypothetical protein DWB61_10045 [Ancylomarina euxinus]